MTLMGNLIALGALLGFSASLKDSFMALSCTLALCLNLSLIFAQYNRPVLSVKTEMT